MRLSTSKILYFACFCFFFASCSSSKLMVNCPDFSTPKEVTVAKKSDKKKYKKKKKKDTPSELDALWQEDLVAVTGDFILIEDSIEIAQTALAECPVLVLKDKSRLLVRVTELLEDSVKVETCDEAAFELKFDKNDLKGIYYDSSKLEQIVWHEPLVNTDSTYSYEPYYVDEYQLDGHSQMLLKKANRKALWALIFGMGSIILSPLVLPTLFGIPALILGIKALKTYLRIPHPSNKKNTSIIAIVLGGLATLFVAIVIIAIIVNIVRWGI